MTTAIKIKDFFDYEKKFGAAESLPQEEDQNHKNTFVIRAFKQELKVLSDKMDSLNKAFRQATDKRAKAKLMQEMTEIHRKKAHIEGLLFPISAEELQAAAESHFKKVQSSLDID